MSEAATTIPPSGLGKLKLSDAAKGLIKTLTGLLLAFIIDALSKDHFPTWVEFVPYIKMAIGYFAGYLGINLATNNVGQLFAPDKKVVTVSKDHLEDLKQKAEEAAQPSVNDILSNRP